ncbi:hypothetical protein HS041_08805 [Planomonospora sp. ID67723]|uniref:hypothetical protein n=1 Tax=Planomonospora sp. ID67723 TaxID=2738134 RepID=UPI0018C43B02|nr:hypothetical protein [Planomonospora sp. ID67723]MBG0827863.1 hypothetical protein [Planomonospora sp. ID67723]
MYVSQFSNNEKPINFHASRGWGTPFLVAPVVMITDSIEILRVYMTAVSALALFGAFRIWLSVRRGYAAPVAAAVFGGCWVTVFYGNEIMPNLYTALGSVALVGLVLRVVTADGRAGRIPLVMITLVAAVLPMFRLSDALVVSASLAGATAVLLFSRRRRPAFAALVALGLGSVIGFGQWVVEAVLKYGGVVQRLDAATRSFGAPQWLVEHNVRALDGPTLCVTAESCGPVPAGVLVWLAGTVLFASVGLPAGWRRGHRVTVIVPAVVGTCIAGAYLYYPGLVAPRYLLAAYGLWAIVVAEGFLAVLAALRRRLRAGYAVACACLVMGGYLFLQTDYLVANVTPVKPARAGMKLLAEKFRDIGYRHPCVVYGWNTPQIAHYLDCEAMGTGSGLPLPASSEVVLKKAKMGYTVIAVYRGDADKTAPDLASWPEYWLTSGGWNARINNGKAGPHPVDCRQNPSGC